MLLFSTMRCESKLQSVHPTTDGAFIAVQTADKTVSFRHILGLDMTMVEGFWHTATVCGDQWLVVHNDDDLLVVSMLGTSFAFQFERVDQVLISPKIRWMLICNPGHAQVLSLNGGDAGDVHQVCRVDSPDPRVIANEFEWLNNDVQLVWKTGKTACLYDLQTGQILRWLQSDAPMTIKQLLDPAGDKGSTGLWLRAHATPPNAYWTPNGQLITFSDDGYIFWWNRFSGELVQSKLISGNVATCNMNDQCIVTKTGENKLMAEPLTESSIDFSPRRTVDTSLWIFKC
jgi:hypothetical protein